MQSPRLIDAARRHIHPCDCHAADYHSIWQSLLFSTLPPTLNIVLSHVALDILGTMQRCAFRVHVFYLPSRNGWIILSEKKTLNTVTRTSVRTQLLCLIGSQYRYQGCRGWHFWSAIYESTVVTSLASTQINALLFQRSRSLDARLPATAS